MSYDPEKVGRLLKYGGLALWSAGFLISTAPKLPAIIDTFFEGVSESLRGSLEPSNERSDKADPDRSDREDRPGDAK